VIDAGREGKSDTEGYLVGDEVSEVGIGGKKRGRG